MTDETSQPPLGWRYVGNQVKLWRTDAGFTREELGKEVGYGYSTIESIELGRRRPTERLLQIADQMCGARGKLLAGKDYLRPEPIPARVQDYMRYEAEAVAISSYQPLLVPGLLQTEETMRVMFSGLRPLVDDETIEERVSARLARQVLLEKQTTAFSFVIQESVLRLRIGGLDAHGRQLLHLLKAGEQRNVTIQVMATAGGWHPGLAGGLVLLETPEHERLAYLESQELSTLYTSPERVSAISQVYTVVAQQSLGPQESLEFIGRVVEEL
ncbi:Scr1 family TA system antitoxin-like transcriptional regulator [Streptomyces sp. NPDC001262]|uniref:helix-turn-helix domain-containing protein n=1 Tax=unclassified Streptomyces TaxID=2593676 RepID=UPI0036837E97